MNIKHRWRREKTDAALVILALSVLLQILLWARMNLKYQYIFDFDASKLFYHVMYMWKEKTLLIPDWVYMTTGEWDCASLPALLFYGLTGDIKLSFGIANACNVVLFAFVVSRVFQAIPLEQGRNKGMLLAISLILMPYCWGMLDYSNMLFYGGAQYIYKVLLPVWLISLYVGMPSGKLSSALYTAAFFILAFATASSSGLYVFLCGLFPILCCRFFRAVAMQKERFDRKGLLISIGTMIVYAAGFGLQKAANLTTRADILILHSMETAIPDHLVQVFKDFLYIIQIIPTWDHLEIFSFDAIICYLKIAMLAVLVIVGFGELSHCFMIKTGFAEPERMHESVTFVKASLSTVFIWNLIILLLTDTKPRYHLIGFIPFMILACITLAQKLEAYPLSRMRNFLWMGVAAAAMLLAAMLFIDARDQVSNEHEKRCKVVISEAEAADVQTVVLVDDGGFVEMIRPLDPDRDYVTYFSSLEKLVNYDVPASLNDMSLLSKRHMLVAQAHLPLESLPESLQERYTLLKDEWGMQYYIAEDIGADAAVIEGEQPY